MGWSSNFQMRACDMIPQLALQSLYDLLSCCLIKRLSAFQRRLQYTAKPPIDLACYASLGLSVFGQSASWPRFTVHLGAKFIGAC